MCVLDTRPVPSEFKDTIQYMLEDSTQNHLNWHKTQLVLPACPWLNFFRGPGRVYTASWSSQKGNVKQMYLKLYNWINSLIFSMWPICDQNQFKRVLTVLQCTWNSFVSFSAWQLVAFCFSMRAVILSSFRKNSRTGKSCCRACCKCWTWAEGGW